MLPKGFFKDKMGKGMTMPMIPLRDMVVVPKMCVPLFVGREKSVAAVEKALQTPEKKIFVVAQKDPQIEEPALSNIHRTGTICKILQSLWIDDGNMKILIEGSERAKITGMNKTKGFYEAVIRKIVDTISVTDKNPQDLIAEIKKLFTKISSKHLKIPHDLALLIQKTKDPADLGDLITANIPLILKDKQEILDETCIIKRLEKVKKGLNFFKDKEELDKKIKRNVNQQMEQSQREYYLNEKMKAIQRELGKKDEAREEIELLKEKIEKAKMPKDAYEKAKMEIKRLEMMPPMSAETGVIRTYLDLLVTLPWSKRTKQRLDIEKASQILEEDHYGLKKVKERILEYLAVCKLVKRMKGPILCFIGPPGVGKTSLAKSIARATGRKFVRLALGGVRDEAEIRGHRRTYIGALPGRIIQSIRKAGAKNPVFLLDEVDKMSMDFRGDPSAALLEVLDPEQNHTFSDHYLEVEFDLSEVLFICTANILHNIPRTLQDRLEVINIPGYTEEEKLNIASKFLVKKQLEFHGLKNERIDFTKESILSIIRYYTREAGVRNLEREIANVCRKLVKGIVSRKKTIPRRVTKSQIEHYLGPKKYLKRPIEKEARIGLVCGLAWTEVGGEIMHIETTVVDGKGELTLTGMLGDIMQESCKAALTYIRSRANVLNLEKDFHKNRDIHIHVPEGSIQKDGPSAGIAIATTIASALTNMPIKNTIAMTGEITLRGRILPIGGFKEKILAAHRARIETILAPKENEKDLIDIPKSVRNDLKIILVEHMDEVLDYSLLSPSDTAENIGKIPIPTLVNHEAGNKPQNSTHL